MAVNPRIFRQYDIRGVVGDALTREAAQAVGRGYAALLRERGLAGAVAVGRDNRPSGLALRDALVGALTAAGVTVVDVGEVPTPTLYWTLHHLPVVGGIQITGSHNPPEFNGFKLCIGHASVHSEEIQHLRALSEAPAPPTAAPAGVTHEAVLDRYVADLVQRTGRLSRPLKVVVDAGPGVASLVARPLFDGIGAQATYLFCESDG
ncbi:MAG: phosphomannomutase, partial [Gemmatimonadota bacterium]